MPYHIRRDVNCGYSRPSVARAPRGATGTVRGMPGKSVTTCLGMLLESLGPEFQRAEAAGWLRAYEPGWNTAMVEAMLHALGKVPGVKHLDGEPAYTCPKNTVERLFLASHRTWRMAVPNLDLDDALCLAEALDGPNEELTPSLERLRRRLAVATRALP